MRTLRDLPDERRAAKIAAARAQRSAYASGTILPESDRDVTEGRVVLMEYPGVTRTVFREVGVPNGQGGFSALLQPRRERVAYPACVAHGAMNALTADCRIWRCSECGVGAELVDA